MSLAQQHEIQSLKKRLETLENRLGGVAYDMRSFVKGEIKSNTTVIEQAEAQFGMYTALCVYTIDEWKQNRIRWYSPIFHDPKVTVTKLPWAHAISSMGGFDDCGLNWVPPAGSTVCIVFENGNRSCPYYLGTTWHRDRGPDGGHNWGYNIQEYKDVYDGKRNGYLVGPNDGSQVFPPWNTENYNGFDLSSFSDFSSNPDAQKLITYPNIYGFSTPEKHRIKMVDGDAKCNRKWKRFEITSSRGNWIMLKDDHLHYAGQWANPQCQGAIQDGDVSCVEGIDTTTQTPQTTVSGADSNTLDATPIITNPNETTACNEKSSNSKIIGGHPNTGQKSNKISGGSKANTKYYQSQTGANPFFKHKQECRPYSGANTPQGNMVDLPQTGIQIMSISGHTFVMDDSVEEPSGDPTWDKDFDFGCNDHYVGRSYWKSATGHSIELSDIESPPGEDGAKLRGEYNYIKLLSAAGNKVELNDHTISQDGKNVAGNKRGIHIESTSKHAIDMVDEENEQDLQIRTEGGQPVAKAKKAYVKIRSGFGLRISLNDDNSQEEVQSQNIDIFCPQTSPTGQGNAQRGPHQLRFQAAESGPGTVFLRVGGNYIIQTYDNYVLEVGNTDNPSGMETFVSKDQFTVVEGNTQHYTLKTHEIYAQERILLLAGSDCSAEEGSPCGCGGPSPCIAPILVYDPCSGGIKISDRVYASVSGNAPAVSLFQLAPFIKPKGC